MIEKPWIRNAGNLLIVNSIFAALAGILLVFVLQDKELLVHWYYPSIPLALAFWLFAWAAEEITTAIDEKDVRKYVYTFIFYNVAVVLLFGGLAFLISLKFSVNCWVVLVVTAVLLYRPWLKDLWFLFFNRKDFHGYLEELDGSREPGEDHSRLMRLYFWIKGHRTQDFPHDGVYTRLAPSKIHGVGVFAIRDIPKGTNIFENDTSRMVRIEKNDVANVNPALKQLYEDFCVIQGNEYRAPENFNSMTVGWYLNESKRNPNVRCTEHYDFIALRDIKRGEELLVDYSTYSY